MKKTICSALTLLAVLTLLGCASGTALVTGTQRPATSADEVVVYTEPPEQYEVIGIVSASSDMGWTAQGSLDYAIAELKKQAAKIGANGVIIEGMGQSSSGGVLVSGMVIPVTAQNISGKAIYVEKHGD